MITLRPTGRASLSPPHPPAPRRAAWISAARRAVWLCAALLTTSVLTLARWLAPDPHGFGTHRQLGLGPCQFHARTGVPCPGCGLTTSFASMAHFHPLDALRAHAMGPPCFLLVLALALYAPLAAKRAHALDAPLRSTYVCVAIIATAAVGITHFACRVAGLVPSP